MQTYCRTAILLNRSRSQIATFWKDVLTSSYRAFKGRIAHSDDGILPEYDSFARLLDPDPVVLGTGDRVDAGRLRDCELLLWEWGWTETPARTVLAIREQVPIPLLMFPGQLDRFWREMDIRTLSVHMQAALITDAVGVMLEDTAAYYRSVAPSARVFHMPVPVAVDYFSSLGARISSKERNRLLLTAPSRFTGAASQMHIATYLVFRELRRRMPKLEGLCFVYDDQERADCERVFRELGISGSIENRSYLRPIDRYIATVNHCYVGLGLSSGLVQGRTAMISACLGIPMVLGDDVETHRRLFPRTSVKWYDVAVAEQLCLRLLEDECFHGSVASEARAQVGYYDVPQCRRRILEGVAPLLSRSTAQATSS